MRISVGALLLVSLPLLGGCDPDTSPVPSSKTDAGSAGAAGTGGGGSAGMGGGLGGTGGAGGTGGGAGGEGATGGSAGAPEDAGSDVGEDAVQETGPDVAPDGPSCCPTEFAFTPAVAASSVEMRGTPDPLSWSVGTPMTLQGGTWIAEVCLDVTREYRYKFVIDGTTWVHDDTKPKVDDGQGGFNNVIGPLLVCE